MIGTLLFNLKRPRRAVPPSGPIRLAARLAGACHCDHREALQRPRLAVVARLCVRERSVRFCYVAPHFGLLLDPEAGGVGAASVLVYAGCYPRRLHRQRVHAGHARPQPLRSRSTGRSLADGMTTASDPVALAQALIRCESVTPAEAGALTLLEGVLVAAGFECHRMTFSEPGYPDVREPLRAPRQHRAQPLLCRPHRRRPARRRRRVDARRRSPPRSATAFSMGAAPST